MATREGYRWFRGAWRPSAAQARVLDELAADRPNAEIAARLGLSLDTVKWHVSQLLAETGSRDRAALARWWRDHSSPPARRPLFVPLLRWLGGAAVLVALALGVTLLVPAGSALSDLAARLRPSTALHLPTEPLPATPPAATGTRPPPAYPVDVLWVQRGTPPMVYPNCVALDGDGNVYVGEKGGATIRTFDSAGRQVRSWGSEGTGEGQFSFPAGRDGMACGLAVDGRGHVLVADTTGRVQRFDRDGVFLGSWLATRDGRQDLVTFPSDMAIAPDGSIYVTELRPPAVYRYAPDGTLLARWGSAGTDEGEFASTGGAGGVTVGSDGTVYVSDRDNQRIQAFDPDGRFLFAWGGGGVRDGELSSPLGLGSDRQGNVYVADARNHRVQKFDARGRYLGQGGVPGIHDGDFTYPQDVAIDGGFLYVTDLGDRLQKLRLR